MATVSELETLLTADDSDLKRGLDSGDNRVASFARNTNQRLGTLARNFASFGLGTAVAIGGAALTASIAWEDSFADVEKTVGDLNDEELAELELTLRGLASEGVTGSLENAHEQLAAIAALGGQLGVAGDDLDEFTQTVASFGVAAESVPTEQAALFFAQFANLTGLDIGEDVDNIADAVVHLGNNLSTTEPNIISFASRMGSLANFGFDADEILGWGAAMASLGLSAELGSTNFALSVGDMQRAAREGGAELSTFATVAGMTATEFAALAESDPSAAFDAFIEGLGELSASDAQATLDELNITGTEQRRVIMSLAGSYDTVVTALDLAEEGFAGNNAAMDEATAKADTTGGKLNLLKNRVTDLAIALGDELSPGFNTVLDGLIAFTEGDAGGGLSGIALGFTEMAEAMATVATGGDEFDWSERLEIGIGVFGELQEAMNGTGRAALALQIMWDNAMRSMERAVLDVWIEITGMSSGLRQMVLDATAGQVDIMPNLTVDREAMMDQVRGMELADALTSAIREDMQSGSLDLSDNAVTIDGMTYTFGTAGTFEMLDAEDFGVEGRAAVEAALRQAFSEADDATIELLVPLAAELDIDTETMAITAEADIEEAVIGGTYDAIVDFATELSFDTDAIGGQAEDEITGAVEGSTYDASININVTLLPGQINASAVDAAIANTAAGRGGGGGGGGGNDITVNSYGQNAYELADIVDQAVADSGG